MHNSTTFNDLTVKEVKTGPLEHYYARAFGRVGPDFLISSHTRLSDQCDNIV